MPLSASMSRFVDCEGGNILTDVYAGRVKSNTLYKKRREEKRVWEVSLAEVDLYGKLGEKSRRHGDENPG